MDAALAKILTDAETWDDSKRQQEATLQLFMFLEMRNRPVFMDDPHFYQREVPEAIRSLSLDDEEQQAVVVELRRLVLAAPAERARVALLSALAVTAPWLGTNSVLDLLLNHRNRFNDEETRQLLVALDHMLDILSVPEGHVLHRHVDAVVMALQQNDPRSALDDILAANHYRTEELARNVKERVDRAHVR